MEKIPQNSSCPPTFHNVQTISREREREGKNLLFYQIYPNLLTFFHPPLFPFFTIFYTFPMIALSIHSFQKYYSNYTRTLSLTLWTDLRDAFVELNLLTLSQFSPTTALSSFASSAAATTCRDWSQAARAADASTSRTASDQSPSANPHDAGHSSWGSWRQQ